MFRLSSVPLADDVSYIIYACVKSIDFLVFSNSLNILTRCVLFGENSILTVAA